MLSSCGRVIQLKWLSAKWTRLHMTCEGCLQKSSAVKGICSYPGLSSILVNIFASFRDWRHFPNPRIIYASEIVILLSLQYSTKKNLRLILVQYLQMKPMLSVTGETIVSWPSHGRPFFLHVLLGALLDTVGFERALRIPVIQFSASCLRILRAHRFTISHISYVDPDVR